MCAVIASLGACAGSAPSNRRGEISLQEGDLFAYQSVGGIADQETTVHVALDGSATERFRWISDPIIVTSVTIPAASIEELRAEIAQADLQKLAGTYLCSDRGITCNDTPLETLLIPSDGAVREITFEDRGGLPAQLQAIGDDVYEIVEQIK